MGGHGSGRPSYRPVAKDGYKLSVFYFQRQGLLKGRWGTLSWTNDNTNEALCSISYRSNGNGEQVWLQYTTTVRGEKHEVNEPVHLTTTRVNFGLRSWWICPRCKRRCGMLHLPPGAIYFQCLKCYNLTYRSSKESGRYRTLFVSLAPEMSCSAKDVKNILSSRW
jgi:hypothetical protein